MCAICDYRTQWALFLCPNNCNLLLNTGLFLVWLNVCNLFLYFTVHKVMHMQYPLCTILNKLRLPLPSYVVLACMKSNNSTSKLNKAIWNTIATALQHRSNHLVQDSNQTATPKQPPDTTVITWQAPRNTLVIIWNTITIF